jgi:methylmalonyl-CoA/ethylmalonyl-CoA epimerase
VPIDHVGIAVRDTAQAFRLYVDLLGLEAEPTEVAADENVKITFLRGANARIELLEPLPGDSAVARFLEKRGEGLHHLCLVVPDLAGTLVALSAAGYQLVDQRPRRNGRGDLLAFVHPKSAGGVLVELYQACATARGGACDGSGDARGSERPAGGAG